MPPNMRRPTGPEGPTIADMLRPSAPDRPGMQDLQKIHIQDRAMLHGMPRPPGPGAPEHPAPAHRVPGPHPGAHDMPGPDRPTTQDIPRPRTPERPTMHDAPEPRAQDRSVAYHSPEPPERTPGLEWPRDPGERPRPPSSGPPQNAPKHPETDAPRPLHETPRPADAGLHRLMRAPAPERHQAPGLPPHYPYMRPQLRPFGMPILRQGGPMMPHFGQFQEMHRIDRPPPFRAREPAPPPAGPPSPVPDRPPTPTDDVPESIRREASPSPPDVKPQFLRVPVPVNSASAGPVKVEPPGEAPREGGGVFGGLVSYFSSQREDDLDA